MKFERGKYHEALKYTDMSVRSDPENPEAWILLSDIQRNMLKNKEALESLQNARKVSRGLTKGFIDTRLGQMFELNKEYLRAADHYSRAEAFPGLAEKAAFNAATCYYHAGQFNKAMKHIDLAEKLTPGNEDIADLKKKIEDARFGAPKETSK